MTALFQHQRQRDDMRCPAATLLLLGVWGVSAHAEEDAISRMEKLVPFAKTISASSLAVRSCDSNESQGEAEDIRLVMQFIHDRVYNWSEIRDPSGNACIVLHEDDKRRVLTEDEAKTFAAASAGLNYPASTPPRPSLREEDATFGVGEPEELRPFSLKEFEEAARKERDEDDGRKEPIRDQ